MRILIGLALWMGVAAAQVAAPLPAAGNVALPLDEYNRLIELGSKPAKKADAPPVPFVIQRAEIKLSVTGANASGTVQLEGELFSTGTAKVPLMTGLTVFDARRTGSPLPLLWDGAAYAAVLSGPGAFDLTLDAGMPVTLEPGRASVTFAAPQASAATLTLTIPGDHTNATMTGGLILARASSGGKTTIQAALNGGERASLWWTTSEPVVPATPKEARYLSDVKSLITVGDQDLSIAALAEITVLQGDPRQFDVAIPAGWAVAGATGSALESSETKGSTLQLTVSGQARSYAFLITLERPVSGAKAEIPVISVAGAQRETGEMVVEGEGTMELTATEAGGVKRMDAKEASPYLRGMAHQSLQAAFRYHRQAGEDPKLGLEWTRFPDSNLLAAVAQSATVTTLVTSEGRSLTEVKLSVRNRAQPFLKVNLPPGASIVSAEVAGQAVKPVQGADGSRVPLLRTGFRPTDVYPVSFVIMHSGTPFAKKGGGEFALPKMDVPIALVEWELFLPARYRVKDFGGDAIAAALMPMSRDSVPTSVAMTVDGVVGGSISSSFGIQTAPGMISGVVVDPQGAVLPSAAVALLHEASGATFQARSDANGRWSVAGVPSGRVRVTVTAQGFKSWMSWVDHVGSRGSLASSRLDVGSVSESVEVTAAAPLMQTSTSYMAMSTSTRGLVKSKDDEQQPQSASANVANLQRRVAGVLPIPIDVQKAGASYRFVRPLVVDEETKVSFTYRAGK